MHANGGKECRAILVAGLSGGSGKSVVAVGLVAALARKGLRLTPFKKGPDYIDAGWLALAAGRPCYNLDPYLMSVDTLTASFERQLLGGDMAVVEGNRGLYDGVDVSGSCSSAELSVQLGIPVLLVVDCTKATRTIAALVLGCLHFDQRVRICGVVLNRIAGARHRKVISEALAHYTGVPVLGVLPKIKEDIFSQRHLGVTPFQEHASSSETVERLGSLMTEHLDLDRIISLATLSRTVAPASVASSRQHIPMTPAGQDKVRIGVIKDAAFQFYYRENLEALLEAGADLVEINALREERLPKLDALYIGGGFPETSAGALSANRSFRQSVKEAIDKGLPVYAECGGLIYLGRSICLDGEEFPLVGVFAVRFSLSNRPQAHGYTVIEVRRPNPFYPEGLRIKGHEFRYSRIEEWQGEVEKLVFAMERGVGFMDKRDGLLYRNTLALYTHVHALGTPAWAPAMVAKAEEYRSGRIPR